MRVADIGCGPGRFALDALRAGARLTLADLSNIQLNLARGRIEGSGFAASVDGYHQLDAGDLSAFADAEFDAVVCYGGVISYTREHYVQAIDELVRIAKPGAAIIISVMSLWGTMSLLGMLDAAAFLESADEHLGWDELLGDADVVFTKPGSAEFHQPVALFSARGARRLLEAAGCEIVTIAAANPLSQQGQSLPQIEVSAEAEERLTALELACCEELGLVDAGQHLVVVARKRS